MLLIWWKLILGLFKRLVHGHRFWILCHARRIPIPTRMDSVYLGIQLEILFGIGHILLNRGGIVALALVELKSVVGVLYFLLSNYGQIYD